LYLEIPKALTIYHDSDGSQIKSQLVVRLIRISRGSCRHKKSRQGNAAQEIVRFLADSSTIIFIRTPFINKKSGSFTMKNFDVVVIGGGPAGEGAAVQAARAGRTVALLEREHVIGGTCVNWGTIPSKTLRESALFVSNLTVRQMEGIRCQIQRPFTMTEVMYRERHVVQRELEIINRILNTNQIQVLEGHGCFLDPYVVSVIDREGVETDRVRGEVIIIAVGTTPNHPPGLCFDGTTLLDSNTILHLAEIPQSMIVLGAGVIGVEYACIFSALGVQVTLLDSRQELLPYLDQEIVALLKGSMTKGHILFVSNERYRRIQRVETTPGVIQLDTESGAVYHADLILYTMGRDGNTNNLGLERIGIRPNSRGLLEVNDCFQTDHSHIYAVGDVIGYPALASTSAAQGRQAIRHAFQRPGPIGKNDFLPFAVYTIPEIGFVGATEQDLQTKGGDYIAGYGRYEMNPRGQILEDHEGMLKLLFESGSMRLLGAHLIGSNAAELIHIGQAFLRQGATAELIAETLFNYPTLSDLYRHAAWEALTKKRRTSPPPG
jgi:NAD(P) transhydrogenase